MDKDMEIELLKMKLEIATLKLEIKELKEENKNLKDSNIKIVPWYPTDLPVGRPVEPYYVDYPSITIC